jgi:hypothetical protein
MDLVRVAAMAQAPINVRLSADRLRELELRARARNMPLRTLAQRYLEEGMRIEAHPLIRFVDGAYGRSATLVGTDFDVWQIIWHATGVDGAPAGMQDIVGTTELNETQIQAALDYHKAFSAEIDGQLELAAMNTRGSRGSR